VNFDGKRVAVAGLGVSGLAAASALAPLGAELTLVDDAQTVPPIGAGAPSAGSGRAGRDLGGPNSPGETGWAAEPGGSDAPQILRRQWPAEGAVVASDEVAVEELDLVVASPGWSPASPLLARARAAGKPIWSEVELAWRLRANPEAAWLVVTGTNGKTTTVQMLESILAAQGRRVRAAGNLGDPLVTAVADPTVEVFAVELSSFQLHHTYSMEPLAGAVLNIAPDHLDWHASYEEYQRDKGRALAQAQRAAVYNAADPATRVLAEAAACAAANGASPHYGRGGVVGPVGFTLGAPGPGQVGLAGGWLADRAFHSRGRRHARELASVDDLAHLAGPGGRLAPHVVANALAAAALALAVADVDQARGGVDGIGQGLRDFKPGAHRLAQVAEVGGARYVDDSKATNAHAADAALAGFAPGSVVWIAGGLAKGARFEELVARRADRLKAAVLIGRDRSALVEALAKRAPDVPVVEVDGGGPVLAAGGASLDDGVDPGGGGPGHGAGVSADGETVMRRAVQTAARLARPGDVVLLAPASASMDQFASYAERGDAFARAVAALARDAAARPVRLGVGGEAAPAAGAEAAR
jgi:UDP-N-acetylmuramoylalanine--D-glutamate ligase